MIEHHAPPPPPTHSSGNPQGTRSQHLVRRGIPVLLLVLALAAGVFYWGRADHAPAPQAGPGPGAGGPLPVEAVTLWQQNVPLRPRFLGQTEASQVVEIRSRVRGFLLERAFEEGQAVKQGQVLFRIDPKPFEADLAVARAALASAQATHERAVTELRRFETLAAQKNVTANELDQSRTEERVALAAVRSEEARVARAELDLSYTTVNSPIDGVTERASKDVGSYIDDTTNSLLTVVRKVDPMYVRYAVSEQDLLRWQRQRETGEISVPDVTQLDLEITLGDGRPYRHRGRINFVDVRVDPATGTAVVRGTVPNPENTLLPGQFVHASVLGIDRLNTIMVPQKAVVQAPSGPTVYVVNDKNVVEQRPVTLGDWVEQGWVIEQGLKPGERVVVDRLMQVRPGAPVAVAEAPQVPATRPVAAARP
jgi:membrane fusion protein (multidrug efflux system)